DPVQGGLSVQGLSGTIRLFQMSLDFPFSLATISPPGIKGQRPARRRPTAGRRFGDVVLLAGRCWGLRNKVKTILVRAPSRGRALPGYVRSLTIVDSAPSYQEA